MGSALMPIEGLFLLLASIHSVRMAFLFMCFKRLRIEREQIRQILLTRV